MPLAPEPLSLPPYSETVEKTVGKGVVGLAHIGQGPREGGAEQEERERVIARHLVDAGGPKDLGSGHRPRGRGGLHPDKGVVNRASGVDNTPQDAIGAQARGHVRNRDAVGHVAPLVTHGDTSRPQVREHPGRSRGILRAAAHQSKGATALGTDAACQDSADVTGAASNQHDLLSRHRRPLGHWLVANCWSRHDLEHLPALRGDTHPVVVPAQLSA